MKILLNCYTHAVPKCSAVSHMNPTHLLAILYCDMHRNKMSQSRMASSWVGSG